MNGVKPKDYGLFIRDLTALQNKHQLQLLTQGGELEICYMGVGTIVPIADDKGFHFEEHDKKKGN